MSGIRELALAKAIGGSGGGGITVEPLTVTANGQYAAPSGKAYSPVNVEVPQNTGENIPVLLTVTTPPNKINYAQGDALDLTGIVVTAKYADGTMANATNDCVFSPNNGTILSQVGTQEISITYTMTNTSTGHNYVLTLNTSTTVSVTSPALTIVPFSTGTDEQIAAMIDAAHAGTIDLQQDGGWAVGDVRAINISAFTGAENITYSAQSVDIVITSFDEYMGCGNVLQFDFKTPLTQTGKYDLERYFKGNYNNSAIKVTTLPALANAMPQWLVNRMIEFSVLGFGSNGSMQVETIIGNKLALRSIAEVTGESGYEGEGTQLHYYTIQDNRKKYSTGYRTWWTRTHSANTSSYIRCVDTNGSSTTEEVYVNEFIAPFGCL